MNWLTDFVRPKIRALVSQQDVPDNLWHRCPDCERMLFHRDLKENLSVCSGCGHHMRISGLDRFTHIFDKAEWVNHPLRKVAADPLKFKDTKKYTDRLKDSRNKTGFEDAIHVGSGKISGQPAVIAAFDFSFMGGSMGMAVGEAIVMASQLAIEQKAALIIIPSSGGARMQEGIMSLMQMPRTVIATTQVKEAGLPYITLLTDPTTGGVSASFAMLGDIAMAEPGCIIGFAGARVIEQTVREKLPEGFQRAEYLLEHGMIDMVVHRKDLPTTLGRVIGLLLSTPKGQKQLAAMV